MPARSWPPARVFRVEDFSLFLGGSAEQASAEELRRHRLHLATSGVSAPSQNATVTALRFFFTVTLGRGEATARRPFVREPRKLAVVLGPEEVLRLVAATPGLKYRATPSRACGARRRASQVVSLKVTDSDDSPLVIRVEPGKEAKKRDVMLSEPLLDLLRAWWRAAAPQGGSFATD